MLVAAKNVDVNWGGNKSDTRGGGGENGRPQEESESLKR